MSCLPLRRKKRQPLRIRRKHPRRGGRLLPPPLPRPARALPETLERAAAREDERLAGEVRAHRLVVEGLIAEVRRLRREAEALANA